MPVPRSCAAISLILAAFLGLTACGSASSRSATTPTPSSAAAAATSDRSTTGGAAVTGPAVSDATVTDPTVTGPATATAITASADDTASTEPPDGSSCSNATVEVNKVVNAMPEGQLVVDIEIEGKCTVSLKTGYTQDNVASALKLCQAAQAPAYANGASGVSVVGNGVELAAGTTTAPCAAKA